MPTQRRGFTMAELVIVIAIIALLVAVSAGAWTALRGRGDHVRTESFLALLDQNLRFFEQDYGRYPWSYAGTDGDGDGNRDDDRNGIAPHVRRNALDDNRNGAFNEMGEQQNYHFELDDPAHPEYIDLGEDANHLYEVLTGDLDSSGVIDPDGFDGVAGNADDETVGYLALEDIPEWAVRIDVDIDSDDETEYDISHENYRREKADIDSTFSGTGDNLRWRYLQDAWGTPLVYLYARESESDVFVPGSATYLDDHMGRPGDPDYELDADPKPDPVPHPNPGFEKSFELWSLGPDRRFDTFRVDRAHGEATGTDETGRDYDFDNITATPWE